MAENKNALAELAETLRKGYVSLVVNDRQVATFTTAAFPELDKARRIVAEIDDVFRTYAFDPHGHSFLLLADRAVKKCRAIAEEGGAK